MLVKFLNANESRHKEVNVEIGDKVKVTVWNVGRFEGIISDISEGQLSIKEGCFSDGCYEQVDYSELENCTSFDISTDEVFECSVANFESITPLNLLKKALRENYCGSDYIKMSPSFYRDYMKYMKDGRYAKRYCQYGIVVDRSLNGYTVEAVPNLKTIQHNLTPLKNYWIDFYQSGVWTASQYISVFPFEMNNQIEQEKEKFTKKTGIQTYAFKVRDTDKGEIVFRGSNKQLFKVA